MLQYNHMRFPVNAFIFFILVLFTQNSLYAHMEQHQEHQEPGVGIEEKLGEKIPLDLMFHDESDHRVKLRQLVHQPTILAPVYYSCPDVCSFLLYNLAGVLNQISSEPGKEYQVVAVSFDETEKPDLAREKKSMYLKMIEKPFPEDAWRFLTGDHENIQKLTDAIGFHFKREGRTFLHPVSLIILSSEGKVTRYMYGTEILPFDLKMALLEASEGKVGPTVSKVLRFCFSYDPKGQKYVFNTLKVTGIVTLAFALFFFIWQIPHFWLLLLNFGKDYEKAGFPSLTRIFMPVQLRRITFSWVFATAVACLMIPLFGLVNFYGVRVGFLVAGFWLVWKAFMLLRSHHSEFSPRPTFNSINVYVLLVMFLLTLDHLL
jgi:protein SCO1/2